MSTPPASPRRTTQGRTARIAPRLRTTFDRLRATFERLRLWAPAEVRAPARLHAWLGVDRSVCYRMYADVETENVPASRLAELLPGSEGATAMLGAFRRRHAPAALTAAAAVAVERYAALIHAAGGSQAKLVRLARQSEAAHTADPVERRLAQCSRTAAEAMGIRCDRLSIIYILAGGAQGAHAGWHAVSATSYLGLRAADRHFPIATFLETPALGSGSTTLDEDDADGWRPGAVLGEFSSDPLPSVVGERHADRLVQLIEVGSRRGLRAAQGRDVVIGNRFRVTPPQHARPHQISMIPRVPASELVIDVLVEPSLNATDLHPRGAYFVSHLGPVVGPPEERWFDRGPACISAQRVSADDSQAWNARRRLRDHLLGVAGISREPDHFRLTARWPMVGWQVLAELRTGENRQRR